MALPGFLYINLASGLTATGTTPVTNLGYSQLNSPQPRHRLRFAATSANFAFDLGSAQAIDVAALISTVNVSTVRLRISSDSSFATSEYDSGVQSDATSTFYNGNFIGCPGATYTKRYVRWDITGTNPMDIGLAPLGLLLRPAVGFDFGAQEGRKDLSERWENDDTGSEFGIVLPLKRVKTLTFSSLTEDEVLYSLQGMEVFAGAARDVLFVEDSEASWLKRARVSIWGSYRPFGQSELLASLGPMINLYQVSFKLTERL
jgi:hypothetical protein